jgi:hypothetical protein
MRPSIATSVAGGSDGGWRALPGSDAARTHADPPGGRRERHPLRSSARAIGDRAIGDAAVVVVVAIIHDSDHS